MSISSFFSSDYSEARAKFLSACAGRKLSVDSLPNPNAIGARGEGLFSDVVRIGRPDASKLLVLTSATHGVEGYCGSGAQVGLLREGYFSNLPDDTAILMVHAMNPYGFSHNRRVNEDNVDLNRNFMAFDGAALPVGAYGALQAAILPDDWDGPARAAADRAIDAYIAEHGLMAFQAAASEGQYHFADGIFHGGTRPVWSHQMFLATLRKHAAEAELVGFIDFHTGLGPYGYGELIMDGTPEQQTRVKRWYGDQVTDPSAGTSTSAPLTGTLWHGAMMALPDTKMAFITLEYGTYDITRVLNAVRADNWLYQRGDVASPLGRTIKQEIRDTFYPDHDDWKDMVWSRAVEVVGLAMAGLEQGD